MSNTISPYRQPINPDNKLAPIQRGFYATPPNNASDSFSIASTSPEWQHKLPTLPELGPSPPITPETNIIDTFEGEYSSNDRLLFPQIRTGGEELREQTPLFAPDAPQARREYLSPSVVSPRPSLVRVPGTTIMIEHSPAGVGEYYHARMDELRRYGQVQILPEPMPTPALERDAISKRQLQSLDKPHRVIKSRPVPRATPHTTPKLRSARIVTPSPKLTTVPVKRASKPSGARTSVDETFTRDGQVPKHKRAAPSKKVDGKDEDRKWRDIPDYCPPLDSLNASKSGLRHDWKAEPRDISREIDADVLGPAEYNLASGLRLLPQQYLANKRRMFQARVQHLKEGKNFTKTAAQLACNIDVNKASRLWGAFDSVGWFDKRWFEQWI